MAFIDTLKYLGCASYIPFPNTTDKISSNTYTTTGSVTNYILPNYTKALYFNGAANVTCSTHTLNPAMTAAVWVNPTVVPASGVYSNILHILTADGATSFTLRVDSADKLHYNRTSTTDSSTIDIAYQLTAHTWYHCVMIHAGPSMSLYVNGILVETKTINSIVSSFTNVIIGKSNTGQYYTGYVKNFMLFNNGLTANQIKKLYNYTFIE